MNMQELEHKKLNLIAWIAQIQDIDIINKLLKMQTKNNDIPQWQKDVLDKRMEAIEKGTMKMRSWEEAKKEIFKK